MKTVAKIALLAFALLLPFRLNAGEPPIKIGVILSTSGPFGFLGDPEQKALEMLVKATNDQGGIRGRKIELVSYDDASETGRSSTFAKRLIESDKVDALIGGTTTAQSMAILAVAERAETPYISVGGGLSIIDPVKKWVFKTPHTDRMVAERILADMKAHGVTNVGLISESAGFGQSGRKETLELAPKYGIDIVADEQFAPKDTDMTPQFTKLRGAPGLQGVLIFAGAGAAPAIATKNYAAMNIGLPLWLPHAAVNPEFIKLAGAAAEHARMPTAIFVVPDAVAAANPQKPIVDAFYKNYEEAYKTHAPPFAANTYDAGLILIDALKRAGTTDKAKLRDAIEQTKGLPGLQGVFTMSATDHLGLPLSSLHMFEVKDGKFTFSE